MAATDQFIFNATLRVPAGRDDADAVNRRLAALLDGDIWQPQDVATIEGDDVLLEVFTSFPESVFIPDFESELSVEQQALNYAADELTDVIGATEFALDTGVTPSDEF